jgi:hypothetical protein
MRGNTPPTTHSPPHQSRLTGNPPVVDDLSLFAQMMIDLLLFLQKQSLAFAVYLFGIGTLLTGPGLEKKHM